MYDAQILRILLYGTELWGFQQFAVIQQAHMFACKQFVNVSVQTANKLICGNLGRHPVFITFAVRYVKYWLQLQIYQTKAPPLIIIIMYIYHALINALSAHMIHMNLNMIFVLYKN